METIGFIGGGNMAEALIKGIITAGLYGPPNIYVSDIRTDRLNYLAGTYKITAVADNKSLPAQVQTLVLSVKPQNLSEVLEQIKAVVSDQMLIISIAAGKKVADIDRFLGQVPIVRVMPNTPALIGQGASGIFANEKAKPMLEKVESIFLSVGKVAVLDNEDLMDAVTAVSGSGPAYYFLLIEELIKAAVQLGLDEDTAKKLVLQTAKGAALLAESQDAQSQTVAELRRKVTSPGGTTEAALNVFEAGDFSQLVQQAVKKARDRGRELSG